MEAWHPSGKHSRWHRTDCIKQILQLGLQHSFITAKTEYIFIKKTIKQKIVIPLHSSKLASFQLAVSLLATQRSNFCWGHQTSWNLQLLLSYYIIYVILSYYYYYKELCLGSYILPDKLLFGQNSTAEQLNSRYCKCYKSCFLPFFSFTGGDIFCFLYQSLFVLFCSERSIVND